MLPRELSEWDFSLWPGKHKPSVVVEMVLSSSFDIVSTKITQEKIVSIAKLAYEDIPGLLENEEGVHHAMLSATKRLALGLLSKRRDAGALVFYDLNNGWVTTEEGFLKQLKARTETIGYVMIQELMILTNVAVATYAVEHDIPMLFRNHEARSAAPDREALIRQIAEATSTPIIDLTSLQQRTHMLFNRASYGASLLGHYGLNVPAYLHFTSPIRRYADLVIHQQIRAHLKGEPLPYTKEGLEAVGGYLTELAQKEREAASEYFKNKAEETATRRTNARLLDGLGAKDFERAVKVEVRSGEPPSDVLREAWARRLQEGSMPSICFTTLFMYSASPPGWEILKQASIDYLLEHIADAVTILTQACQAGWPEPNFVVEQKSAIPSVFTATVAYLEHTASASGSTVKEARGRAGVVFLAAVSGLPAPSFPMIEIPPATQKAQASAEGKNPISVLMERSQSLKVTPPSFNFKLEGQSHMPAVTCTASFMGHEVKTVAPNKQEAKTAAAKALIARIGS
jgi:ribonuclease R